ncbi:Dual specificity protein phosphatase 19 [Melipona quadrifasciata]|uniref:Dual specificity protein phosphatase 19 n=1 Tax=Melipona quadrifasciata TaxID=166423 RepID=A0A0M8ZPX2_9HYME|nr:Dual specificity protein phosphatase 19 [Melipona quadrifasciata]
MDLNSLIKSKKIQLKKCKTVVTNMLGQKYEEINGIKRELSLTGTPFVIDDRPDLQVAYILPGLYLSSQDPVVSKEILQKHEIHHILSIGIDASIKFDNIKYYYCDLSDLPESDLSVAIKKCIKIINEHRNENILVHCNAGVSRSPAIVISYIMVYEKVSYDDAYTKVKNVRNCIKPNEGFVQQLKKLQFSSIL